MISEDECKDITQTELQTDPNNIEIEQGQSLDFGALNEDEDMNRVINDNLVARAMNLEEKTIYEIGNKRKNSNDTSPKKRPKMLCEKTDRKMIPKEKKVYEKK